ncbi:MAG: UDP-glucose 4-epimerase GalE [Anaerolineales bacterium]|nr:UDP-glucose 4-epimerase GalE [Anaerolineales bacterium]
MANILVTGGAGYIGAHTVRALLARGDHAVIYDTLATSKAETIGKLEREGAVTFVQGDISDTARLDQVFATHPIDAVIHFAAWKNAGESMLKPAKYFENNVAGTNRLLDSIQRAGVRRIVFSGSCSVYGTPARLPVDESFPLGPESVYAHTKLMCEQVMDWFDRRHSVRYVSLRYFNAAGASADGLIGEEPAQSANLIPVVMEATLGRRPKIQVFGDDYPTPDGTCIRDYIHVSDLADAHVRALDFMAREDRSDIVNVGTGEGTSVKQIIDVTERVSRRTVPAEIVGRRAGDPVAIYADNTKARTVLGWAPQYGLEAIIAHAWNWHKSIG